MKIRKDIICSLVNVGCAIICALLAGCKLRVGSLSLTDFESSLDPRNLVSDSEISSD